MNVKCLGIAEVRRPPNLVNQRVSSREAVLASHQRLQQVEFLGSQLDFLTVHFRSMCIDVELNRSTSKYFRTALRLRSQ